jgi:hypothetical protein
MLKNFLTIFFTEIQESKVNEDGKKALQFNKVELLIKNI